MKRSNLLKILLVLLLIKAALFLIGATAVSILPFSNEGYRNNFHYPENENKNVLPFKTWDAQHYLYLSERGYNTGQESNRFSPLYPLLIFLVSKTGMPTLWSAYILSTVFSLLSALLIFLLAKKIFAKDSVGYFSVIFLFSFPSAFFLSLPYTESLFLFLSMAVFYFLEDRKYVPLFIASLLLPLTRPTGIFIIVPIFIYLVTKKIKVNKIFLPTFNKKIALKFSFHYLLLLAPLVGALAYFLLMKYFLGDSLAGIKGLSMLSTWNIANVIDPFGLLRGFLSGPYVLHGFQSSIIDKMFFVFFLAALPFVYRLMPRHYFYFTLAIGLVPLFGSFTSYTRYLLPAFPIFIMLAYHLSEERKIAFRYSLIFAFISLQTLFFIMHILNYWAA